MAEPQWGHSSLLTFRGRVYLYRGATPRTEVYGAACRGTLAATPKIGMRSLGPAGVRLHLSGAEANQPAALLLGVSRTVFSGGALPFSLDPFGLTGCLLQTSADLLLVTRTGAVGIGSGYASVDLPLPLASPGTFGLYGQWLAFGAGATWPGGVTASMAWRH